MAGEFGPSHYSNDSGYSNSAKQTENGAQQANRPAREYHDYSVQQEAPAKKKGRGRGVMRSLATAAVATVAAVTILPTLAGPSVDVRFEYLNATDSVLEYVLTIENAEEDDEISVLVVTANGNTVNEQRAEEDIVTGTVTGLASGGRYSVVVKSGSSTVASRGVTMATRRTTELFAVTSQCKCAVDGTFHFQIDFIDENGYWSDFRASLTDAFGNASQCDFSDAPAEEHTLAVNDAGMRGNRATLRIVCTTTAPDETGAREPRECVLAETEVNI